MLVGPKTTLLFHIKASRFPHCWGHLHIIIVGRNLIKCSRNSHPLRGLHDTYPRATEIRPGKIASLLVAEPPISKDANNSHGGEITTTDCAMDIIRHLRACAAAFGEEPILVTPDGQVLNLAKGYIPLLANFTFEDRAAKGFRKRNADDKSESPVYFSALELVRDHKLLLLSGLSGSGKTTFAKHLAFKLATTGFIGPHPLLRNENGVSHDEQWPAEEIAPCYITIDDYERLRSFVDETLPKLISFQANKLETRPSLLIILDNIHKAGDQSPVLIAKILDLVKELENINLLFLGEARSVKQWGLPSKIIRHDLLPLLQLQRRQVLGNLTKTELSGIVIGTGIASATPAYFTLALQAGVLGHQAEELLDAWLTVVAPGKTATKTLTTQAFNSLGNTALQDGFSSEAVQQLLAAHHLANSPVDTAIAFFHQNPFESESVLRSVLIRLFKAGNSGDLVRELIRGSGYNAQLGSLLVSEFVTDSACLRDQISCPIFNIIKEGALPAVQREQAGRALSRLGDPRDLTALTLVPAGDFDFGSESHPNSQPVETISLESFRIGIYPVVNKDYSVFVKETCHKWQSPDGFAPDRRNAPATDLSWNDATAYCKWLTLRWRAMGKIGSNELVRLPTEPEWERASRGDQNIENSTESLFPWGKEWQDDSANYEESGFNTTCTVGLFPKTRSPYGCYDMSGNIWEWCTTLWGDNMTTPTFKYPWRNDEREALEAPASLRRVLRGGCFSSSRAKISCTYRGSLEPGGFWRGNGFRIVVAQAP